MRRRGISSVPTVVAGKQNNDMPLALTEYRHYCSCQTGRAALCCGAGRRTSGRGPISQRGGDGMRACVRKPRSASHSSRPSRQPTETVSSSRGRRARRPPPRYAGDVSAVGAFRCGSRRVAGSPAGTPWTWPAGPSRHISITGGGRRRRSSRPGSDCCSTSTPRSSPSESSLALVPAASHSSIASPGRAPSWDRVSCAACSSPSTAGRARSARPEPHVLYPLIWDGSGFHSAVALH